MGGDKAMTTNERDWWFRQFEQQGIPRSGEYDDFEKGKKWLLSLKLDVRPWDRALSCLNEWVGMKGGSHESKV